MNKIEFDEKGNLSPYSIIKCNDLSFISDFFVSNPIFSRSQTREKIFRGFLQYILDINKYIQDKWTIWIGGSFLTDKLDPGDIDIVNIFEWSENINAKAKTFERRFFSENAKKKYNVDAYFIATYPDNDERYKYAMDDLNHWKDFFGHSHESIFGGRSPKGFIEIEILFNEVILNKLNNN